MRVILLEGRERWQNGRGAPTKSRWRGMCRRAVSSAVIRRANTAVETPTTREIKYCDDLFHKGQTGGGGDGFRDYTHRHVHWFGCGAAGRLWWMSTLFFLAGQSSPILAVHNGAAGDTRCFSRRHSERQGHPDGLNWIDLSLFGRCSAGLPSLGLAVFTKRSDKRGEKRRGGENWERAYRENHFSCENTSTVGQLWNYVTF